MSTHLLSSQTIAWLTRLLPVFFAAGLLRAADFSVSVVHSFGVSNVLGLVPGPLIRAGDGTFFGTTSTGGSHGAGTLFQLDATGANPQVRREFGDGEPIGPGPKRLVNGRDGFIYGWANPEAGGTGIARLFRFVPATGELAVLTEAGPAGAGSWRGLIQGSDQRLYAIAGTRLVRLNSDGTGLEILHTNRTAALTSEPTGLLEGKDGRLYVWETTGGTPRNGFIYRIDRDGSNRTVLLDFSTVPPETAWRPTHLVEGSDGLLYGAGTGSFVPGASGFGASIFRMNRDGTGLTRLIALSTYPDLEGSGAAFGRGLAASSFVEGDDGFLYGALPDGGASEAGYLFRVQRDGLNFRRLTVFAPVYEASPAASKWVVDGLDGRLHGTGTAGQIFRIDRTGDNFELIQQLGAPSIEGTQLSGALAQAGDGFLYGTARRGGPADLGVLYRVRPDGEGFEVLHAFAGGREGSEPVDGVIVGHDGDLYGALSTGGANNVGTIFRVRRDGRDYVELRQFQTAGRDARNPVALQQGKDGRLYGVAREGGGTGSGDGAIFGLNTDGVDYQVLHRFTNSVSGSSPTARLLEGIDGRLYGSAERGGPAGGGVVFALGRDGTGFTLLRTFSTQGLRTPKGALVQGPDGTLYGALSAGGTDDSGAIFRLRPDGSGFEILHPFTSAEADGRRPEAGLAWSAWGFLYGTTSEGGQDGMGTVFRLLPDGSHYAKLHEFAASEGPGRPSATLLRAVDGGWYGVSAAGGGYGYGTVFGTRFTGTSSLTVRRLANSLLGLQMNGPDGAILELERKTGLGAEFWTTMESVVLTGGSAFLEVEPGEDPGFFRAVRID